MPPGVGRRNRPAPGRRGGGARQVQGGRRPSSPRRHAELHGTAAPPLQAEASVIALTVGGAPRPCLADWPCPEGGVTAPAPELGRAVLAGGAAAPRLSGVVGVTMGGAGRAPLALPPRPSARWAVRPRDADPWIVLKFQVILAADRSRPALPGAPSVTSPAA